MINKMIENYIMNLKKETIYDFGKKNGIYLANDEIDILYNTIKKDWKTIIFKDHEPILMDLKNKLQPDTYSKAKELLLYYKEKYKKYL